MNGDEPEEIPVRLELERPAPPPPMLIRRVRMLDFGAGSFGSETSMLIAEGRIRPRGNFPLPQMSSSTEISAYMTRVMSRRFRWAMHRRLTLLGNRRRLVLR